MKCLLCKFPIDDESKAEITPAVLDATMEVTMAHVHRECGLRSVMGNHLHITGQCSYIGECNEKSTLNYREEALEVWRIIHGAR